MNWTAIGALALALAVALGAFGAHALRGRLADNSMAIWEKAVFYHFVHALGLLIVPLLARTGAIREAAGTWACALLAAGILVFSGSLYALATSGVRALGAITPIGGLSFIGAWIVLAVALLRGR